ncbi:Protein FAM150B [Oryzias melastigma]|uniref:ALK and LTK ligand 2-like n=1 Tax=Oryzias melastigma TaxID=30732 RepID=A0A3B3DQ18_ORYME|nr:ALK and LTK ligand 2 [Oryzias melastigma]XP_036070959.1 ALK and LTK ligand 2 [Oryzias melastigma]KAF6734904.1 Protein FAM150B [Oryzias melastigma]
MLLPRPPLLSALLLSLLLLLVLLAAGRCAAAPRHRADSGARLRGSGARAERSGDARDAVEQAGRKQRNPVRLTGRGSRRNKPAHGTGSHSRDSQQKEKFIIHLTGPLYFDPKCRKQFYRLYNNTRECTVPAYYKRCAQLLIQLAKNPRCAEKRS